MNFINPCFHCEIIHAGNYVWLMPFRHKHCCCCCCYCCGGSRGFSKHDFFVDTCMCGFIILVKKTEEMCVGHLRMCLYLVRGAAKICKFRCNAAYWCKKVLCAIEIRRHMVSFCPDLAKCNAADWFTFLFFSSKSSRHNNLLRQHFKSSVLSLGLDLW